VNSYKLEYSEHKTTLKLKLNFMQAEDDFSLQLNHEAIVKIFGACTVSPYLAIGMEFMAGGSLYDILHVEQCILTTSQQEQMLADCLEAMKYLHRRNVTHRDIKSMSIMVS